MIRCWSWLAIALLYAAAAGAQPAEYAETSNAVSLMAGEFKVAEHRVGPEVAIHLTAQEYTEATKASWIVRMHGPSPVVFDIVVSENGGVNSAKLIGDGYGREEEARAIEMARVYKPWIRDGVPSRVRLNDSVRILPPELWAETKVPFPDPWDLKSVHIGLKRTGCYGDCPSYEVSIDGEGTVKFKGGGTGVKIPGDHVAHLSPEAVRALVLEFKRADFFSARDAYSSPMSDVPTQTVTLLVGGRSKVVFDRVGTSAGLPMAIFNLEDEIDEVSGTARWVKGDERTLKSLEAERWPFGAATAQNVALYAKAVASRDQALIDRYLAAGGPAVSPDPGQTSPVCVASGMHNTVLVKEMLEPAGATASAKVKVPAYAAEQCLADAARSGSIQMLQYWLDRGADPTLQPMKTETDWNSSLSVLANGVASGKAEIVRKLLEYKVDVKAPVWDGEPLLYFALEEDGVFIVEKDSAKDEDQIIAMLIEAGADVQARRAMTGDTLIFAAHDYPELVKPFLAAGVDIEARDHKGDTALIHYGFMEPMVRELLANGADPAAVNMLGETALSVAKQYQCSACLTLIEGALKWRAAAGTGPPVP